MSGAKERTEILARLPLEALRRARNSACERGDLRMADEALAAMNLRVKSQHDEIADCGQLFEHIEPPSPQNGGRFVTSYTGDPIAWMAPYMSAGVVGKINRNPDVVAREVVDLRAGERVQVVRPDGSTRGA